METFPLAILICICNKGITYVAGPDFCLAPTLILKTALVMQRCVKGVKGKNGPEKWWKSDNWMRTFGILASLKTHLSLLAQLTRRWMVRSFCFCPRIIHLAAAILIINLNRKKLWYNRFELSALFKNDTRPKFQQNKWYMCIFFKNIITAKELIVFADSQKTNWQKN